MECIKEKRINVFENLLSSEKTLPPNFQQSSLISQAKNPIHIMALQNTGFDMH